MLSELADSLELADEPVATSELEEVVKEEDEDAELVAVVVSSSSSKVEISDD